MNTSLRNLVLCAVLWGGLDRPAVEAEAPEPPRGERRALVVGVGRYANPAIPRLEGPENDAELVRTLLIDHLEFAPADVRVLSTSPKPEFGPEDRPTRARILTELAVLTAARPEFAVVYLSGHGSYVPDQEGEGRDEVDGTDEVFLPADAGPADAGDSTNVLLDDEIDAALMRLEDAGSFVWFWTDSCSSGTQDRGADEEVREVSPAALGFPSAPVGLASPLDEEEVDRGPAGRRVVFTACRSGQRAKSDDAEHPLDRERGTVKLGVFTRLVAEEIARSEGTVTYQNLIQRVVDGAPFAQDPTASGSLHSVLLQGGERSYDVTPVEEAWRFVFDVGAADGVAPGARVRVEIYRDEWVEAELLDVREETAWLDLDPSWGIRGGEFEEPRAARMGERELEARFAYDEARYEVSAGSLAGVHEGGTFLAEWGDGERAWLQVVELQLGRSLTIAPGGVEIGDPATARLVLTPRPRRVAIVENGASEERVAAARAGIREARLTLSGLEDADWFLELGADRHVLRLGADAGADAFWVGTGEADVESALARVFREQSLRRLGMTPRLQPPVGLRAELCTRAAGELDPSNWSPVGTRPVSPGTWAGLRVTNTTDRSYTAWMFILYDDHEIDLVRPDDTDRRIVRAGVTEYRFRTDRLQFFDDDQGPGRVLVLFVEDDRTRDFSWLEHAGLDRVIGPGEGILGDAVAVAGAPTMRSGDEVGSFLASFAEPTRGGAAGSPDDMFAQLLSFEVAWDVPTLAGALGPVGWDVEGDRGAAVRALLAGPAVGLDAEALNVTWVEGHEGTCAAASDGAASALVLDLDGELEEHWEPELVLLERGGTRTAIELDAAGAGVRKRLDEDGDGVSERVWRRSPGGWAEVPGAREPLLLLADMQLGEHEWSAVERVRAVFATLKSSARAAWAGSQDAKSSFAPEGGAAGSGEAPAPMTETDVRAIVDELVEALEEDLPVPLEVELLEDGQVNARAWREKDVGKIVVFRGLIDAFGGDADLLRAVLAHELVHVVEVHSVQRTGAMDLDLHLMRAQETQADLEGADLLEAAGHPRRDLTLALRELDDYTKSGQVLWHQIVSGDHPSFYARIAALEPESMAAKALTAFERGLAFLECRRPDAAKIAFEEALSLAPQLDEARFNLVRAELQSYYDELPRALREAWLEPEFGPVLTEVSTIEVRGDADLERYLELVRLAEELPEGVRDPQRQFLRGTIAVLHPEDERESLERGVLWLGELTTELENASGDHGSIVVATGDPSDPTTSRLALMPLSAKELRLQAFTNMALGLHRLGRGGLAWETLMGAIRPDPPFQPPSSLASNLSRLRPPELDEGDRDLLVAYLQLQYQTVNPGSEDHVRCETALKDLAGEQSLAGLYEAGLRYAPPTVLEVLGGELVLHQPFARDDDRFGKPASAGPLTRQYPGLRHYRWEDPEGEGDLVIFTEDDRLVQATTSIPGASLTLRPAEGRPGTEPARVRVGMTATALDALLGNTYRYHSLRNPGLARGKISTRGEERWRYYAHLNLGVLVLDDVAQVVTATAALR